MSLEDDVQGKPYKPGESFHDSNKHPRLAYSREFLLSLSDLDVCKKLPSGFDQSILSDLEDTSQSIQDRERISIPFRRAEYSSSPPIKGEAHSSSRGIYGRWDSRPSERYVKDSISDSQSDSASDTGRRFCNDSRRSGQSPEHDGLLGRPSAYAGGFSAPKVRGTESFSVNRISEPYHPPRTENFSVNRISEPYHPPRPYKAVPNTRRDAKDSFNDETFGSLEGTSLDRVEEEKRRRESFELMRKEQHKSFQGKLKLNSNNHKDDLFSDISDSLDGSKDEKMLSSKSNELDVPPTQSAPNNDSSKSSFPPPGFRPLIPPGFKGSVLERSSNSRSSFLPIAAQAGRQETEKISSHAEVSMQNGIHADQEERQPIPVMGFRVQQEMNLDMHALPIRKAEKFVHPCMHALPMRKAEKFVHPSSDIDTPKKLAENNQLKQSSGLLEPSGTGENVDFDNKKVIPTHGIMGNLEQDRPRSILDNLFGSTESSLFVQHDDTNRADTWNTNTIQSSKLNSWLPEVGKNTTEDQSWLPFLDGGEKAHSSDLKSTQLIPQDVPLQHSKLSGEHLTPNITSRNGTSEEFFKTNKQESLSAIITCEDLEQTILSEYSESSTLQAPVHGLDVSGAKIKDVKPGNDDHASLHLLSLIQKGPGLGAIPQLPNQESGFSEKPHVSEQVTSGRDLDFRKEEMAENVPRSGNSLTLESLFGSAFMEELQSVKAPVSVQRGSLDASNQREQLNVHRDENSLENNTQVGKDLSKQQNDIVWKHGGFGGPIDMQLPEEESLITVGNPLSGSNSLFVSAGNSSEVDLRGSNKMVNIAEAMEGLSTGFNGLRSIRQEGPVPVRHSIPFRNLHAPSSSPPFHQPQTNHGRPFFDQLNSHPTNVNLRTSFIAPEGIIHRDAPANHQFPAANRLRPSFRPTNNGQSGADLPHPLLQQMQMRGNIPPPHMFQEFARHGPSPPQPSNRMHELNPMQSFPLRQQQPNFAGPGLPLQAVNARGRSNHPEAFQRLMEMELRANARHVPPFNAAGHNQGAYGGQELDLGFPYNR